MRVLIIDSIKSESANFNKLIKESGYDTVTALSVKDAFQQMRNDTFDAVVASKLIVGIPGNIVKKLFSQSEKTSKLPYFEFNSFQEDQDSVLEFLQQHKTPEAGDDNKKN